MKVKYIIILLVLIYSADIQGQNKTYVGINAGANFGSADLFHTFFGYVALEGFRTGPQVGATIITYLPNHVGLETGIYYIQKGWTQNFEGLQPKYELALDYIEVPFLANYYFGNKNFHFFVNAGCFFEYLVGSEQKNIPDESVFIVENSAFPLYSFEAFDKDRDNYYGYGLKFGGGLFYDFDFGTIMVQGTWSLSLSHVYDARPLYSTSGDSDVIPNISYKYNIGAAIGYLIPIGPKATSAD